MSLYRSHGGAFTHQPLMCRAVPCCWDVTHALYTYGRPWYLPQGWLADLLEDLNILWARENWICQGAVLLLCASFQVFDTDMSLCPSQWAKSGAHCQMGKNRYDTDMYIELHMRLSEKIYHYTHSRSLFGKQNKIGIEIILWQARRPFKVPN